MMSDRSSTSPARAGRTFWGSRTAASAIFVAMAVALGYLRGKVSYDADALASGDFVEFEAVGSDVI